MKRAVSSVVLVVALALGTGALLAAPPVSAPPPPPPPAAGAPAAQAPSAPEPESIPVPQIARRAEEVAKLLREYEALRTPDAAEQAVESRLEQVAAGIRQQGEVTERELGAALAAAALDGLTEQWQALRADLVGDVNLLARRATRLESALGQLAALRATWTKTGADARASRAPAPVLERIESVLAGLDEASRSLQAQRSATLVLQDRLAQQVLLCEDALGRVASARQHAEGRLWEPTLVPLWRTGQFAETVSDLPGHLRTAIATDVRLLRQFARDQRWKFPIHLALFLGLVLLMRAGHRRTHLWVPPDGAPTEGPRVFDRPVSAALMVSFLALPLIYSPPIPRAVAGLETILAIAPALRLMRVLVDPRLMPVLYVLGAFFLADLVRNFASVIPALERPIFLVEMLAATALVTWLYVSQRPSAVSFLWGMTLGQRALQLARGLVLVVCATAFVAAAAGYMALALLLGSSLLGAGYLALMLYVGVRVGDGLAALVLRVWPLNRLGMVRRRGGVIERRVQGLLRWVAGVAWLVFTLKYFRIWNPTVQLTQTVLGAEAQLGWLSFSLGEVLLFGLTVGAAFAVSALVRFTLEEEVYPRLSLGRGLPQMASSLVHYFLLLAGFLLALGALGVDLTKITILAGALGVGIGFGLQGIVNNFVSGVLVLFERKINVGDAVEVAGIAGLVQQLGMRACVVRTWEGAEVIVPNASLTSEKVTNWTLSDRLRRVDVAVRVAYDTQPEMVLDILRHAGRAHPEVLKEPAPAALFLGFGNNGLRFELRVWTERSDRFLEIQTDLAMALHAALGQKGIAVPLVAQRDVRLRQS